MYEPLYKKIMRVCTEFSMGIEPLSTNLVLCKLKMPQTTKLDRKIYYMFIVKYIFRYAW
jgi:hypothetical protein